MGLLCVLTCIEVCVDVCMWEEAVLLCMCSSHFLLPYWGILLHRLPSCIPNMHAHPHTHKHKHTRRERDRHRYQLLHGCTVAFLWLLHSCSCSHSPVSIGTEKGHQKILGRHLRLREDHSRPIGVVETLCDIQCRLVTMRCCWLWN